MTPEQRADLLRKLKAKLGSRGCLYLVGNNDDGVWCFIQDINAAVLETLEELGLL